MRNEYDANRALAAAIKLDRAARKRKPRILTAGQRRAKARRDWYKAWVSEHAGAFAFAALIILCAIADSL